MRLFGKKLRVCIVGCKRGLQVGRSIRGLEEFEIVGVCDLDEERAKEAAEALGGISAWTDFEAMLAAERPDIAFVATNTQPRSRLVITAAQAGVPGVIAEKPMAMSMGEAKAALEACQRHGAKLIVTHQRRMGSDLVEMRSLIDEGALGEVYSVRVSCAGDLLTDGTHAINSMRWFLGDEPAEWVLGQVFRVVPGSPGWDEQKYGGFTGFRYGHLVETGAVGIIQFSSGVRGEVFTGRAQLPGRAYQDYEVIGTKGRLWRSGDRGSLRIWDEKPGGWRDVEIRPQNRRGDAMTEAWKAFAKYLRVGGDHPLSGEKALADHELVMAIYESARLNSRVDLPLQQDEFPLKLMIEGEDPAGGK